MMLMKSHKDIRPIFEYQQQIMESVRPALESLGKTIAAITATIPKIEIPESFFKTLGTIAGDVYPKNLVKSKFLKLNYSHVEYVINCLGKNTTKVRNIKSYLLASLFNAGSTISSYYRAEVNHDMPQYAG